MRGANSHRFCHCCKQIVLQAVYDDHAARAMKTLEDNVAKVVLLDPEPPYAAPVPQHTKVKTTPTPSNPSKSPEFTCSNLSSASTGKSAGKKATDKASQASKGEERTMALFRELRKIDDEGDERYQESRQCLQEMQSPPELSQVPQQPSSRSISTTVEKARASSQWFTEQVLRLQGQLPILDDDNQIYANSIISQFQNWRDELTANVDRLTKPLARASQDTSTSTQAPVYDSARYFNNPILAHSPETLIILMIAVILNLIGNLARGHCNLILRMGRLAVQIAGKGDESSYPDIPGDIRTARKRFQLDPVLTVYAVCTCGKLHAPTSTEPFPVYPATCNCGAKLTKLGSHNGIAIRTPHQPYVMQSFPDHCARVYSQPGNEELIRRQHRLSLESTGGDMTDISEGPAYRDLPGPDGGRFIDCSTEIRTIWALSYDGYNPGTNKAAGKTASIGSLAMVCLSLPPAIRNRPENMFLAGLIPGPRQPSADGLNPFVAPLIDQLHTSYHTGTFFSRTYEHPNGIRSREAVLPAINDLPAARKLVGGASHSATIFCMYCHVLLADINNIDMDTDAWRSKTSLDFCRAVEAWRDAPTAAKKKKLYKESGVRWSELLRLEYWDPLRFTVIDGMHNLFLGLVRHHFCEVIGAQWEDATTEREVKLPSQKHLQRGRKLLNNGEATFSHLRRFSIPTLQQLSLEQDIKLPKMPGKTPRKREYLLLLLGGNTQVSDLPTPKPVKTHHLEETDSALFEIELGEGSTQTTRHPMLLTQDLQSIQEDIKKTHRPSNQPVPPANFGSPSHGKLKADEWRACIEFDLPVSLVKLWEEKLTDDDDYTSDYTLLLESTFLLAIAIRFATSHRTSPHHREKYTYYMKKYLQTLLKLHPHSKLRPNHHNALHLPFFLELFGPIHGWWMFPFERLIGMLQKQHTNFKFGQMEKTVMNSFCATSHLKNILNRQDSSSGTGPTINVLQKSLEIVHQCLPDVAKGSMLPTAPLTESETAKKPTPALLERDVVASFSSSDLRGVSVNVYQKIHHQNSVFTNEHTSRSHSTVFFQHSNETPLQPAIVRQIFEFKQVVYLVVHCLKEKRSSLFDRYPDFGAQVWTRAREETPQVIPLLSGVYAGHLREWGRDELVLKPIIMDF